MLEKNAIGIVEFCEKRSIKWQPINLKVNAKGEKIYNERFGGYSPKSSNDNPNNKDGAYIKDEKEWRRRQSLIDECEYIAVHTRKYQQYDADTELYRPDLETPYYLSSSKGYPHYFIELDSYKGSAKDVKGGELLTGTWGFCKKDALVYNADKNIQKVSVSSHFHNRDCTAGKMDKYIEKMKHRACGGYKEWFETICGIYNTCYENMLKNPREYCVKFSQLAETQFDEKAQSIIDNLEYKHDGLKVGSLQMWAKEYVPKESRKNKKVDSSETPEAEYQDWKARWEKDAYYTKADQLIHYTGGYEEITCQNLVSSLYNTLGKTTPSGYILQESYYDEKNDKWLPFYGLWIQDLEKRAYHKQLFLPPPQIYDKEEIYNTWSGFEWENDTETTYTDEEMETVKEILERFMTHLAGNTPALKEFMTLFIADIIQNPGRKSGVLPIFLGREGTIKGTFFRLIKCLIGKHAMETSDSKQIFTRFNSHLEHILYLSMNEAKTIEMINQSASLKALVTDENMMYEKKGEDIRDAYNFTRIAISSNEDKGCKSSISDRRNIFIETEAMPEELRKDINTLIKKKSMNKALFFYFKSTYIPYEDQFQWQSNRPITEKHEEVKDHFRDPVHYFFYEVVILKQKNEEKMGYLPNQLYERYIRYLPRNKFSLTKKEFKTKILKFEGISYKVYREKGDKKVKRGYVVEKSVLLKYLLDGEYIIEEKEPGVLVEEIACYDSIKRDPYEDIDLVD